MKQVYGTTDRTATADIPETWRLYPIYGVDDEGTCTCWEGKACGDTGKHPHSRAAPHGFYSASSDSRRIAEMFAIAGPGANVGLATGKGSGVIALDWDEVGCGSGHRRLQRHGHLPATRTHRTGSGSLHELYRFPPPLEHLPSRTFHEYGLEIKADGAGVVLPPSQTNHRGSYEILDEGPLAELPGWMVDLATGLSVIEGGGEKTTSRYRLPERIHEGTRAMTLYRFGSSLRAHGWDHREILEELLRVNAERSVPPLPDAEVRKAARSASRHERGDAATVTPEVLEALNRIEAAVQATPWPGVGGATERSVMVALTRAARRHGTLIPAGVRVSLDFRNLALGAAASASSTHAAVQRLRRKGWLRYDNEGRGTADSGAFVLLARTTEHSTTSLTPSKSLGNARATETVSVRVCAPRLRWGGSLGKGCERVLDALEVARGELSLEGLAAAVGVKRVRDMRRRSVSRLEEVGAVEVSGEIVRLLPEWLEAIEKEREGSGEKQAERMARKSYEWQREGRRQYLAELAATKRKGGD